MNRTAGYGIIETIAPDRCRLCNRGGQTVPAGFRQIYQQSEGMPVYLPWSECRSCKGWFVYPVPSPEIIIRHCEKAAYNDPAQSADIAYAKMVVHKRILKGLARWTQPGALLDVGCSFGEFLAMAREAGWCSSGFEPNEVAVDLAREKGFEVHCGWTPEDANLPEGHFAAITATDSFYYTWHPFETLRSFHRFLKPGGVLAMRVTNKRFILGMVRAFLTDRRKDAVLSTLLQSQFHSIGIGSLCRILSNLGFSRIRVEPFGATAPWCALSMRARLAYFLAQLVYVLSLAKMNLSPGVLVFAQKARMT